MQDLPVNDTAIQPKNLDNLPETDALLSLKELCKELSICMATGRNWLKQKKLVPECTRNQLPYFTKAYAATLKQEMHSGKNHALKSRRNKTFISGNALYRSYVSKDCKNLPLLRELLKRIQLEGISLSPDVISFLAADCALHLFFSTCSSSPAKENFMQKTSQPLLVQYLKGTKNLPDYAPLLDALIKDRNAALCFCEMHPELFALDYIYEPGEDILGLLYLSCKNIGSRKASGAYYTPAGIVKKLISKLSLESTHRILDPCCGTGNFLLKLPGHIPFENIFGNDSDAQSVAIARINMALKFPDASAGEICEHITCTDFLTEYDKASFHCIIGNPPWGFCFSDAAKETLRKQYRTASGTNIESYDVFIEASLLRLLPFGSLAFVLPEAILSVKAHTTVRTLLQEGTSIRYLEYIGNPFDRVQCPSILLHLVSTRKPLSTVGMTVADNERTFEIRTSRPVSPKAFHFLSTDAEYAVLEKLHHPDHPSFLSGNADFALGIVTGNNKKYLSPVKAADNEPVLRGTDLLKYRIRPATSFVRFQPEHFQQTAPEAFYRAPEKLLYRFISDQLIFAYDAGQTLSLNSCNLVLPRIPGMHIKYILSILNSRAAQFIFQKEFHSVKVLRSHIERIPIPAASQKTQDGLIELVNRLLLEPENKKASVLYEETDAIVSSLFGLTGKEQALVKKAVKTPFP